MADKEKILAALAQLDPLDDDQWTTDGSPKVETVSALAGEAVKRQDIVNAAPDFNREKASKGDEPDEDQLKDNGPTVEEYVAAGYSAKNYPPQGFATKSTDEEIAAAIKAEEDKAAGDGTEGDQGGDEPELNAGDADLDDDVDLPSREMSAEEFEAWLRRVPKEELEDIEAALKKQHDAVGLEVKSLQELQKRITRAVSVTRNRIKEAFPNSADAHAIRSFIQSQHQARADRVGRRNEILKGISVKDLDPRAPIDAAMARKNKRGTGRPVRPLVK